jgi:O-antigen/teichoic acid export membrane protein
LTETSRELQKPDVFSGIRWSAIATYTCQGVQFGSSLILARLLAPQHFGLIAMANVFVGLAGTFASLGFNQVVIQRRSINELLLNSLFYATFGFGALLALILACSSPVLGWIYGAPEVTPIVLALSLAFLLRASCLVPGALLVRRMEFGRLAAVDILVALSASSASVVLAWYGLGVWSLVWPTICDPLLRIPLLFILSKWRPRLVFSCNEFSGAFGFGAYLTGNSIFAYLMRNSDNFIIGKFLGPNPLGYYSLAYGIMLKPRDIITRVVQQVLFPILCKAQDNDERFRDIYLRICGNIAFVSFPAMVGFLAIADLFVETVLGHKWTPIIPIIYILGPVGMLQSVALTAPKIYVAKGKADWAFWWGVTANTVFMLSFVAGIPWGIVGVAVSYAVANTLLFIPYFAVPFRLVKGLRVVDALLALAPHFFNSLVMGLSVIGFRSLTPTQFFGNAASLVSSVFVGIVVYGLVALLTRPPAFEDCIRLAVVRSGKSN